MRYERLLSLGAFVTALVSASAIAFWVTRPSFAAKFGPIDDHEALNWMGSDGKLPWSQFWTTFLHKTEIGQWGNSGRFRPAYYLLRVAETVVFGDNPRAWYACVLAMFAITCALLAYTASIWLSAAVNAGRPWIVFPVVLIGPVVAALLFAGMYAWSGIVARLGPSEQLGLLATSVALLSMTKLSLGLNRLWWIPAILGVTTAIFAKESFFSIALVFPIVGTYLYLECGGRKIDLFTGLLGLLPAALLALILAPHLLRGQRDVYGASIGSSRLSVALSALVESPLRRWLPAAGVALLAWTALTVSGQNARRRVQAFLLAVIAWLLVSVFLDAWFYGGNYSAPRYRALTDLVITLLTVSAACMSIAAIRRSRMTPRLLVLVLGVAAVTASALFVGRQVQDSVSDVRLTREVAASHAAASKRYQDGLSEVQTRLARQSKPTVAVVATNGGDYEPAFAVLSELARRSRDRDREYLIVDSPSPESVGLLGALADVSEQGLASWHARPVRELVVSNTAVCVFLNVTPHPLKGCRPGDGIRLVAEGM